jgi:hypothetical protein
MLSQITSRPRSKDWRAWRYILREFCSSHFHKSLSIGKGIYPSTIVQSVRPFVIPVYILSREGGGYTRQRANYDSCRNLNHAEHHNAPCVSAWIDAKEDSADGGGNDSQARKAIYAENCDADTLLGNLDERREGKDAN